MNRRTFIVAACSIVIQPPRLAGGQPPAKVHRLGLLSPSRFADLDVITVVLRELGYVPNQSLVVERRYAEGNIDRLPLLARQLVQIPVDVIRRD